MIGGEILRKPRWRRFLPRRQFASKQHVADSNVFDESFRQLMSLNITDVKTASEARKILARNSQQGLKDKISQLVLATPRAAQAQLEMDRHQGGYRNHKARLFELIEFNDIFVDTVLTLPDDMLTDFTLKIHKLMDSFCKKINCLMFTDEQFDAIVHGLSREIAVYKAVRSESGMSVVMANRVEDAHGVDMTIEDEFGRKMGIDCKTRSSFHFRLLDLKRKGVVTEEERLTAELLGYAVLTKGSQNDFVRTTLLRVSTKELGDIKDFAFLDSSRLIDLLRTAMDAQNTSRTRDIH